MRRGIEPAFAGSGVNADQWLFLDLFIALSRSGGREEAAEIWERLDARGTSRAIRAVVSVGRGLLGPDASVARRRPAGGGGHARATRDPRAAGARSHRARSCRAARGPGSRALARACAVAPGGVRRPPVPARGRRARLDRLMADAVGRVHRTRARAGRRVRASPVSTLRLAPGALCGGVRGCVRVRSVAIHVDLGLGHRVGVGHRGGEPRDRLGAHDPGRVRRRARRTSAGPVAGLASVAGAVARVGVAPDPRGTGLDAADLGRGAVRVRPDGRDARVAPRRRPRRAVARRCVRAQGRRSRRRPHDSGA